MAIGELARILNAVNTIFERIEQGTGLSRRAAAALAIMTLDETPDGIFSNEWLRDQFVAYRISTPKSVTKDASTAKSDLLASKYITIGPRLNEFSMTNAGSEAVIRIQEVEDRAIDDLGLLEELRDAVRKISISILKVGPHRQEVSTPDEEHKTA